MRTYEFLFQRKQKLVRPAGPNLQMNLQILHAATQHTKLRLYKKTEVN